MLKIRERERERERERGGGGGRKRCRQTERARERDRARATVSTLHQDEFGPALFGRYVPVLGHEISLTCFLYLLSIRSVR